MERLQISRGNANMNLRSLTDWNLVTKTRRPDSRKDYYEAEKDVWHITAQIIQERERREIEPVRQQLEDCAALLAPESDSSASMPPADRRLQRRIENLIELVEVFEGFSRALLPLVEERKIPTIKRLMAFAQAWEETRSAPEDNPSDDPDG
jgi:DNA-binding transcriptional regulator GbsR (MarR family)